MATAAKKPVNTGTSAPPRTKRTQRKTLAQAASRERSRTEMKMFFGNKQTLPHGEQDGIRRSLAWPRVPAVRSIIEAASASDPADPDAAFSTGQLAKPGMPIAMTRLHTDSATAASPLIRAKYASAPSHPPPDSAKSEDREMTDETPDKLKREMRQTVDATGPITRCRPGKARGKDIVSGATDPAAQWLKAHRADQPLEDQSAERLRLRMAQRRQRQQREDKRNAPAIRQANRERRIADLPRKRTHHV